MEIQYQNLYNGDNPLSKSYILLEGFTEIGSISGGLYPGNVFISVVNIFSDFQGKGIGYEVFKTLFNEINEIEEIKIIRAVWCLSEEYNHCENGMSTNLNEFQKQRQIKTDEESVFLTPTGKWVNKLGFNCANIISVSDIEVIVDFTRSKPNPINELGFSQLKNQWQLLSPFSVFNKLLEKSYAFTFLSRKVSM